MPRLNPHEEPWAQNGGPALLITNQKMKTVTPTSYYLLWDTTTNKFLGPEGPVDNMSQAQSYRSVDSIPLHYFEDSTTSILQMCGKGIHDIPADRYFVWDTTCHKHVSIGRVGTPTEKYYSYCDEPVLFTPQKLEEWREIPPVGWPKRFIVIPESFQWNTL